jgi:hypothetical protein
VQDAYQVEGKTTHKQEFVTCGGVSLQNINMQTMESNICNGMYFSGEVLDIDGITGGFNFQAGFQGGFQGGFNFGGAPVAGMADRLVVMSEGRMEQVGLRSGRNFAQFHC